MRHGGPEQESDDRGEEPRPHRPGGERVLYGQAGTHRHDGGRQLGGGQRRSDAGLVHTYLARRIIAEHPETWEFVERRWAEITQAYLAVNGGPHAKALCDRRLEALAVARGQKTDDIEHSDTEELEATAE